MKRKTNKAYLLIFVCMLAFMSIPKESTEKLQGITVAMAAPAFDQLLAFQPFLLKNEGKKNPPPSSSSEEMDKLRLENTLLREEMILIKEMMQQELMLIDQMNGILKEGEEPLSTKNLRTRHALELRKLLRIHLEAVPAKVIFRSPDSWNSSFWINAGSAANESLGRLIVAKNSPVLAGSSVIGVIDFVGKRQSRVRLITDSGLTPSVRVARGGIQNKALDGKLHACLMALKELPGALGSEEFQQNLIAQLETAAKSLSFKEKTSYLAKGELCGSSKPLWGTQRHLLKGTGFNYDFSDDEGPARDLRTGKSRFQDPSAPPQQLVKPGDLLVTTGMDGVFPPGLMVAEVAKVHPLKEGDSYYELEAFPVAGNLDEISLVFVIPPLCSGTEEIPSFKFTK